VDNFLALNYTQIQDYPHPSTNWWRQKNSPGRSFASPGNVQCAKFFSMMPGTSAPQSLCFPPPDRETSWRWPVYATGAREDVFTAAHSYTVMGPLETDDPRIFVRLRVLPPLLYGLAPRTTSKSFNYLFVLYTNHRICQEVYFLAIMLRL